MSAPFSQTIDYNFLNSTTQDRFIPKIQDNIYDKSAFLFALKQDEKINIGGGTDIKYPLKYAKNTARGTYKGWDTLDMQIPDNITAAKYDWGDYYVTGGISGTDEDQNSGESQVVSLLKAKMEDAEDSMHDQLATDIFAGTDTDGIIGLATAIATGTYAGIAGGTYTWWNAAGVDATGHTKANMKLSTSTSYVLTLLRNAWAAAAHLGKTPNLVVTDHLTYNIIEEVLDENARYGKTLTGRAAGLAKAGFDALQFRNAPIIADEYCPAGKMYVLNTDYLDFIIHPSVNMKFSGFKEPTNQRGRAFQIFFKGQLAISNRRMFYAFTNLPTS